ncbi:MAG: FAD:protein FMN transferase, partial [Solirubrobacterales bacterium]|nr:FAD:protein FMN transferase [Solirubrobacterales bacterium]
MSATIDTPVEQRDEFACFGSRCTVIVADARVSDAERAVAEARRRLLEWHGQFSRFEAGSELTRLNDAREETVAVSPMMRRVVQAAVEAAGATDGLVDPTLVGEIEEAGYASHFDGDGLPLVVALALAGDRARGRPSGDARWRS